MGLDLFTTAKDVPFRSTAVKEPRTFILPLWQAEALTAEKAAKAIGHTVVICCVWFSRSAGARTI